MSNGYWGSSGSARTTKGVQKAQERLKKFYKKVNTIPQEELEVAAKNIYHEAVAMVPYKTHRLEKSIYVTVSKVPNKQVLNANARAYAPGTSYDYAAIQHDVNFVHKNGRSWHYLSVPFNREITAMQKRIRERLKV